MRRQDADPEESALGRALLGGSSSSAKSPTHGQRSLSQDLPSPRVIQHKVHESPRKLWTTDYGVIEEGQQEGESLMNVANMHIAPKPILTSRVLDSPSGPPSSRDHSASGQAGRHAVGHSGEASPAEWMALRNDPVDVAISEKQASKAERMQDQPSASLLTDRCQRPDSRPVHGTRQMLDMPTASLLTERSNAPSQAATSAGTLTDRSDTSSTHHWFPPVSMTMQKKKALAVMQGASATVPLSLAPTHVVGESRAVASGSMSIRHVWSSEVACIHAVTRRMTREEDDTLMRDEPLEEVTLLEGFSTEGQLWRKGVKPGSRLLCVDGADVEGMDMQTLKSFIEGDEGTPVALEVMCQGGGSETDGQGGVGDVASAVVTKRVSVMRSRSPEVDAAMTAYQEALTMLAGEKVAPLDSRSDVLCHMHRKVGRQVESLLEGKARAEASLSKARKMLEDSAKSAGADVGLLEELGRLQKLLEEEREERGGERKALLEASAEQRMRMSGHAADLEDRMREMADRYDESIADYIAMERETIAYVSVGFEIDFEEVRVRPDKFEHQLRREVSEALHITIDRCSIISLHKNHKGSTIAVIEFLPPVHDDDVRSPNTLVDGLEAFTSAQAHAETPLSIGKKGRGILARTAEMHQVPASEIAIVYQRFREDLKVVGEERDALRDELDAAQVQIKEQGERIRALERLEDEWKETADKLAEVQALVGKDEIALLNATKTNEAVIGDAKRARDAHEEEKKKHALEREQLTAGMHQLEQELAAARELASNRQARLNSMERQLAMGLGEAEGLRGRLEQVEVLKEELKGVAEQEARTKSMISRLGLEKEALEKQVEESRKELEESRLQMQELQSACDDLRGKSKEMVSQEQLDVVKDSYEYQIMDLSRQLQDSERRYFQMSKTLKETASQLICEQDDGDAKKNELEKMLRAEKARCEKLRLDVSRKEQEVQAERMKHEKLAKLSGEDASAALLKLRDETIESKDKEINHLNQAIEDLEAEVNLSLTLKPPSRATLMN